MENNRLVTGYRAVSLDDYIPIVGQKTIKEIKDMASDLKGKSVLHINSTKAGGGVAEILKSLVPLMQQAGLDAKWYAMKAEPDFFKVTKRFHNIFHGIPLPITKNMLDIYQEGIRLNSDLINVQADCIVLHDQQPLGLSLFRQQSRGRWIWYCHVDPSRVGRTLWRFLKGYASACDAAVYHLPEYAKNLGHRQYFIPPAIDPLSEKNREVTEKETREVLNRLKIDLSVPMILQVSRFDRLKNHIGVIEAFHGVYRHFPCQLVLAGGGADDDPESEQVLNEIIEAAGDHPHIKILSLPVSSDLEINVLQRSAAVVVQNSVREGFGLTASEALWKGRPVVVTPVGGLRRQVLDCQTGLLARNSETLADRILCLLNNRELGRDLALRGREYVRSNFILPVYLRSWIFMLRQILLK